MKHSNLSDMDFLETYADSVTEDQILDYSSRIIVSIYLKEVSTQQQVTKEDLEPPHDLL